MKLCSACLLGINSKYNGKNNLNKTPNSLLEEYKKGNLIPVCPEQLGGLSTPRTASETTGDGKKVLDGKAKVITQSGEEVTKKFIKGAEEIFKIVKSLNIKEVIFKQRSPSCGSGQIYDGTFSGKIIKGDGVTTALLKRNGIKVISEEDL